MSTASTWPGAETSPVTGRVRSGDGTEIVFDRSGEGPPLVLVMGAFHDRSSTGALAAALADAFTVYEYDRRGRGESGDTSPYSVEREIEDLAAVINAAGEPVFVFGHSSGAALALEAAARGVPIRALVVHEPPYTEGPSTEFAARLEELVREGRRFDAAAAFLELTGVPASVIEQIKQGAHWAHLERFAPTLSCEIRLCNNGSVPIERLVKVAVPTLALAGENSPPWANEAARAIAEALPDGHARVLEGQGHAVADDVLADVLTGFFNHHLGGAS
jgi:pimeloyl-ACP methyl ester carboxylesterase